MLYRIVRPMKRKGSQNVQFRQRIAQDVLQKARGKTFSIPIGNEIVAKRLSIGIEN